MTKLFLVFVVLGTSFFAGCKSTQNNSTQKLSEVQSNRDDGLVLNNTTHENILIDPNWRLLRQVPHQEAGKEDANGQSAMVWRVGNGCEFNMKYPTTVRDEDLETGQLRVTSIRDQSIDNGVMVSLSFDGHLLNANKTPVTGVVSCGINPNGKQSLTLGDFRKAFAGTNSDGKLVQFFIE